MNGTVYGGQVIGTSETRLDADQHEVCGVWTTVENAQMGCPDSDMTQTDRGLRMIDHRLSGA